MKRLLVFATTCIALLVSFAFSASAQQKKPNILIIWGNDTRLLEHQRLQPGHDGLQDAEH